LKTNPLRTLLL